MTSWPEVLTEDETLDRVLAGASLARFGDGEFNLALAEGRCVTQDLTPPIGGTLRAILKNPQKCLVGIPRQGIGPKAAFWAKYRRPEVMRLFHGGEYASAFISRPDSAPWIDRAGYWAKLKSLWEGKRVTLVRGSVKSLTKDMLTGAAHVHEIIGPARNAYSSYWNILDQVTNDGPVLLCLGPTATVMATEIALRGQQAIDLGHVGMFIRKHERGQPMTVTEEDKAFDRALA